MHIDPPVNKNYCATVVEVKRLVPLDGCDNIVGMPMLGYQAIVGKDTEVGTLGVIFPAETQLSVEYATANNLYRHSELNTDKEKVGYLEDNRRVRAIKLRGHRSDSLFLPVESLTFTGFPIGELKSGMEFDTLNGYAICQKYVRKVWEPKGQNTAKKARVESRYMPEHFDTDNYFKMVDKLDPMADCVLTQKLHGTSIRIGNTIVSRQLNWRERLAKRLGIRVPETEYAPVYGSRKVIKDVGHDAMGKAVNFYENDIWTREGRKLDDLIPQGYIVYGELIGWASHNEPIQKNYTYQIPQGQCELYVYRVAIVNPQGMLADLSWDAVREFCDVLGLKHVPEITRMALYQFGQNASMYLDVRLADEFHGRDELVKLDKASPCDEGVCIRIEGLVPTIVKAKSPVFLQHETKMLDKDEADLEADESG